MERKIIIIINRKCEGSVDDELTELNVLSMMPGTGALISKLMSTPRHTGGVIHTQSAQNCNIVTL